MVADAFLAGIATNLASDVLEAAYRRARVRAKGDAEKAALERAFVRALEGLAGEMATHRFPGPVLSRDEQQLLEEQLERFVGDRQVAELLVAVVLQGKELPIGVLRQRLYDLGLDESTMLADFEVTMIRFQLALGAQLQESAGTAGSLLFNLYVVGKLAALVERLGRLERVLGDPAAAEVPPFGVPQPGSHFVGRAGEIRQLRERFTERGAHGDTGRMLQILTAMHGWPGVGKTTSLARSNGDISAELDMLSTWVKAALDLRDDQQALEYAEVQVQRSGTAPWDKQWEAICQLGDIYHTTDQPERALDCHQQALRLLAEQAALDDDGVYDLPGMMVDDEDGLGAYITAVNARCRTLTAMAADHEALGDHAAAIAHYIMALKTLGIQEGGPVHAELAGQPGSWRRTGPAMTKRRGPS